GSSGSTTAQRSSATRSAISPQRLNPSFVPSFKPLDQRHRQPAFPLDLVPHSSDGGAEIGGCLD
ncbi:hypothetical protein, partial [Muricoccus pecuniae]|uniref:hypothetical protein n=1 Tax=Muricoccus pecuniae TaxID=693023 RepID=UPI001C8652FB